MRKIFIEGASTAYGWGDDEGGGWAARLHKASLAQNRTRPDDCQIVQNKAIPGSTITAVNLRAARSPQDYEGSKSLRVVRILSVGLQESKLLPDRTTPLVSEGAFVTALQTFSALTRSVGASTVFVGLQPIDESRNSPIPGSDGIRLRSNLVSSFSDLTRIHAEKVNAPFVDIEGIFAAYSLHDVLDVDGRHPNAFGHELMYRAIHEALAEIPSQVTFAPSQN